MARLPRFSLPGQPQHVIQRGNNRSEAFCAEDDYRFYLDKLKSASKKHGCAIHAYVLMTNHVHLLMTPDSSDGVGKTLQSLGRYYVQYFNHAYQRTGTLWEGRYRATLIDSDAYLLTCMRYIELNPVRAAMAAHPSEYPWCSYHHTALGQADPLVTPHRLYRALGRNAEERQGAYRRLFRARVPERTLEEIREATNKAWVLGNDRFKWRVEAQLSRRASPGTRGGDRKSAAYRRKANINRV